MPTDKKTQLILGAFTLIGGIAAAIFPNWDKIFGSSKDKPASTVAPASAPQTITGNNNVQISGSNNVVNPVPSPRPCRDRSHGVERYQRTFEVERTSNWMGGGSSQDPYCNQVKAELRGEHPEGQFEVVAKSEKSKTTCAPFNCPQYQYYCKVRVQTDPLYVEKVSSACR